MVLLHEFDDNVAVTVASIITGIVQFQGNNARGGRRFKLGFGLRTGGACPWRQRQQRQWAWLQRQQASSNFRKLSPLASSNDRSRALRTPQVNVAFPNVNIKNVTERSR